ncbi:MAG TPA: arsenate reductase (glutaredoxin) [Gammaproteobacteria bacterium]|uniref:arsenate reductase (glutaredoxin) n=1 Tax=Immundisolibacter sp. TaxID=1934948 RepID=UPI000E882E98|nr:arsenate reductase (glutaredoxin) [Gammaproteobacteria bacterium]HCZ49343.1 arsenate reductase (glutaredoxin) [Gammaproteobacteria bacterium]MCH78781.1 arsenate reductase (glutaredoxin) [Gammaproteobacteria bacterium]
MSASITLLHNPRCSKSRAALALLREHGVEPQVVEYLREPLTAAQIRQLLGQLGLSARELLRRGEAVYKSLGLADPGLSEDALIDAMAANPILIERPVAVRDQRAIVGRPPEQVLQLLKG